METQLTAGMEMGQTFFAYWAILVILPAGFILLVAGCRRLMLREASAFKAERSTNWWMATWIAIVAGSSLLALGIEWMGLALSEFF